MPSAMSASTIAASLVGACSFSPNPVLNVIRRLEDRAVSVLHGNIRTTFDQL
jgi:hypothetical protein